MLLALNISVPDAHGFQDAIEDVLADAEDWTLVDVMAVTVRREVHARYTGGEFAGHGLMLSVLAEHPDAPSCHVVLRASRWGKRASFTRAQRPEQLVAGVVSTALAKCHARYPRIATS